MHTTDCLPYLVLGLGGSGRISLIADMVEGGGVGDEPVKLWLPEAEPLTAAAEVALQRVEALELHRYTSLETIPVEPANLFIVAAGDGNPLDAVEGFDAWRLRHRLEPARILTVVHLAAQAAHEDLLTPYYRACIHFSDAVLLNQRAGVTPGQEKAFLQYFEKECFPCLFERVKKGRVRNPAEVLNPEPRRMSHLFDDLDALDELTFDEEALPEEPIDLVRPPDPYLERREDGSRLCVLPELGELVRQLREAEVSG